jgi:hypothetical protein
MKKILTMKLLKSNSKTSNSMDEEFFAAIKLVSGEEILSKVTNVIDENGDYLILEHPIEVEEVRLNDSIGAKVSPWMRFSKQEVFLVPKDKVITCVEVDAEVEMFYQMSLNKINPEKLQSISGKKVPINRNMGYLSSVTEARKYLEQIFKRS